ncbi:hypothetical protein BDZ88DRAFT_450044 [Geranomyces variabilis]|nr:hypothetical protein BDZ88DRAFT_450044 [Geranomyces variabilis]KAJ3135697.1 hypothetical protein HDU90_003772 [Geranomyces variabilis]
MVHICQTHALGGHATAEIYASLAASGDFAPANTLPSYAPHTVIQPIHIDISLDFRQIEQKRAKARIVHTLANSAKKNSSVPRALLTSLKLNGVGFSGMDVRGAGLSSWTYDGKEVSLYWDTPFGPEEKRNVELTYDIIEPVTGLFFEVPTKEYPDRALHAITDLESERCRYWLATVDFPVVRTSLKFNLRAASNLMAIANGAHVGQTDHDDGSRTTEWKLDQLCPSYLICFAVGLFEEVVDEEVNGIPVKYYAPKGFAHGDIKRAFDLTPKMLRWLPEKVGLAIPWPKYFQIASPHVGGAMENISLVTWGSQYLMDENYAPDRQLQIQLTNIHEMAHTYFGDLLVIRHFEHVWQKESWATYMEACWLEDNVSQDEFIFELLGNADRYIAETEEYMRPMVTRTYGTSWQMFDNHTYPGGGWRIHMLRKLLGDESFWAGVKDYVNTFQGKTVETDDFRKCLEKASGINLVKFFDQWFYSKGYPKFKGEYNYNGDKKQVQITLEQTLADKAAGIPIFDCTVEIEVTCEGDEKFTGEVVFDSETRSQKATVVIPVGKGKPTIIRVDPGTKVLCSLEMNPGEDILGNTAKSGADVISRVRAYKELIKSGTYTALKKVQETVAAEPFYGVRIKVAQALGKAKTEGALKILIAMLKTEKNATCAFTIATALEIRDEKVREALLEYLKGKDLPYRAHNAALQALGVQRNKDDLKFLLSVAQDSTKIGQHAIVRSGALRALGKTREPEAFEYLLTRVTPGLEPERARPSVAAAIAIAAQWQPAPGTKRAIEALCDLLKDEAPDVRLTAIHYLCSAYLEARSALSTIAATKPLWDSRDWSVVQDMIKALRESPAQGPGGSSQQLKTLMKSVEELEQKLRKLEEKEREREAKEKVPEKKENAEEKKDAAATPVQA